MSGDQDADVIRRARAVLGDGWRLSEAVLGSEAFAGRVAKDVRAAHETLGRGRLGLSRAAWAWERPRLSDVVDGVLSALALDDVVFTEQAMSSKSQLARQLITWIWVRHLGGKQVDVVRELNAPTYSVARWYGKAVQRAARCGAAHCRASSSPNTIT